MKIMVVHRQARIAEEVQLTLKSMITSLRYCDTALDALIAIKNEAFDLIICEIELPLVTGIEVVRSLRARQYNSTTKVVLISDSPIDKFLGLARALDVTCITPGNKLDACLNRHVNNLYQ